MMQRAGPTFIGIGVQKCATSWLHEALHAHPAIYASEPKEVDFFSAFYDRGHAWYERHFAPGLGRPIRGETSPSYFYHPAAPARAKLYEPALRVVVVFRDPVERAYSNHLHELRAGHLPADATFEEGLVNNPCYVEQGRYATHLAAWLDAFPREQVLALIMEEVVADPAAAMGALHAFLGADPEAAGPPTTGRQNESVAYRMAGLQGTLQRGGRMMRRAGLEPALEAVKALPPVRRAMAMNKRDLRAEAPPLLPDTRADLARTLAPEMRALAGLLGRGRLPWRSFPAEAAEGAVA